MKVIAFYVRFPHFFIRFVSFLFRFCFVRCGACRMLQISVCFLLNVTKLRNSNRFPWFPPLIFSLFENIMKKNGQKG